MQKEKSVISGLKMELWDVLEFLNAFLTGCFWLYLKDGIPRWNTEIPLTENEKFAKRSRSLSTLSLGYWNFLSFKKCLPPSCFPFSVNGIFVFPCGIPSFRHKPCLLKSFKAFYRYKCTKEKDPQFRIWCHVFSLRQFMIFVKENICLL